MAGYVKSSQKSVSAQNPTVGPLLEQIWSDHESLVLELGSSRYTTSRFERQVVHQEREMVRLEQMIEELEKRHQALLVHCESRDIPVEQGSVPSKTRVGGVGNSNDKRKRALSGSIDKAGGGGKGASTSGGGKGASTGGGGKGASTSGGGKSASTVGGGKGASTGGGNKVSSTSGAGKGASTGRH
mmetsp:Transcript_73652/g.148391  ORF Transcript_73652/g.148391 Transcript_73652/m.148391 type:complete len:185 (-) Transcript_73652:232-786(-)